MTEDRSAWIDTLPRKRMGSGVLVRDELGRVLVVKPTYKQSWEIPGGAVEADESPRTTCRREVEEELGLVRPVGRCCAWSGRGPSRGSASR